VLRAKQFRETTRNSASFDMDVYFDRVDQNPATYVTLGISASGACAPGRSGFSVKYQLLSLPLSLVEKVADVVRDLRRSYIALGAVPALVPAGGLSCG